MTALFRALAAIVGRLPFRVLPALGAVLAFVAFDVLRIRRRHVIASLRRAGLHDLRTARAVYRGLGAGALELLWMAGRPAGDLDDHVTVVGWDRFESARSLGRGVVVATAHTGNWDLAACACARRARLAVVTKRLSSRGLDAFWQSSRSARGVDLLAAPDGGVLHAARARLAAGGAVALLVDQDPERTTSVVEAPFLGASAAHDVFAATLAARTGAPIVIAFARRAGEGHVVEVVDVLVPPPRAGRAWIERATRTIAARLEDFVRRDPACWLWLHRRWKTQITARTSRASSSGPADSPTAGCTRSSAA